MDSDTIDSIHAPANILKSYSRVFSNRDPRHAKGAAKVKTQSLRPKKEEPMIAQAPMQAKRIISTIVESDS